MCGLRMETGLVKFDVPPPIPTEWNPHKSADLVYKAIHTEWVTIARDVLMECYFAHVKLAHRGRPRLDRNDPTWAEWCLKIDVHPDTVTRWLKRAGLLGEEDNDDEDRNYHVFARYAEPESMIRAESPAKAKAEYVKRLDIVVEEADPETGEILPA